VQIDKKTTGAWLVHHATKLQQVTGVVSYDNVLVAGKAAILLSALSASQQTTLSDGKVVALARGANVNKLELQQLLNVLEEHRLINKGTSGIAVLGVTTPTVLQRAADIFENLEPTPAENAAIALAEMSSQSPIEGKRARPWASDTFQLSGEQTSELFESSEQIGFIDYEDVDERRLYFNGNLFRRDDAQKIARVLGTLNAAEKRSVSEVDELLKSRGCLPHATIERMLGSPLLAKLNAIGMYDINVVSNEREEVGYITRPAAFTKYGDGLAADALDLTKALVSSLTYGMERRPSSQGRIRIVVALLKSLIAGNWVGSATAIGQDYRALEIRRVLEIRSGSDGYGHDMRLLKIEVGEMALGVIESGDVSERSLPNFGGVAVTRFTGPEQNRQERRKKQRIDSKRATGDIITALRTGGMLQ
jgi:hypothetical protein